MMVSKTNDCLDQKGIILILYAIEFQNVD